MSATAFGKRIAKRFRRARKGGIVCMWESGWQTIARNRMLGMVGESWES